MQEQKGGGQSRVKFKAQIWEINFLGPGKEKGRQERGERREEKERAWRPDPVGLSFQTAGWTRKEG